jgi:hypothetical protein
VNCAPRQTGKPQTAMRSFVTIAFHFAPILTKKGREEKLLLALDAWFANSRR